MVDCGRDHPSRIQATSPRPSESRKYEDLDKMMDLVISLWWHDSLYDIHTMN